MKQFWRCENGTKSYPSWGPRLAFQSLFDAYYDNHDLNVWDYLPEEIDRLNWGDIYND